MKAPSICLLTWLRTSRGSRFAVVFSSFLVLSARVDSQLLVQIQAAFSFASENDPSGLLGPDDDDEGLHVYAAKAGWSAFEEELRSHSLATLAASKPKLSCLATKDRDLPQVNPPSLECQCRLGIGSLLRC
jgi:hypothetical protein